MEPRLPDRSGAPLNPRAASLVVLGYCIGSVSFALLAVRWKTGGDIRQHGSGNAGATNVLRSHGAALGVLVGLLDVAKGVAAVLLTRLVTADPRYAAAAGFAAVLGHVFPVFAGFRWGKGVATALGAFLALCPPAALTCFGVLVLVAALTRYVSLGSVIAMAFLPLASGLLFHAPRAVTAAAGATALLVVLKHLDNLKRLARGEERRLKKP